MATPAKRARWRAKIRAARRHARPLTERLCALGPVQLEVLAPSDRHVLAHYYGLDGQAARTLNEVASELKLSKFRAAQMIRRAVAQLLGLDAIPTELGGRETVACAICGAPVELSPSLARSPRARPAPHTGSTTLSPSPLVTAVRPMACD